MNAFRPWRASMFAQIAVLIALALMAAHIVGYFLILDQQQRANLIQASEPGITRFAEVLAQLQRNGSIKADDEVMRASDFNHHFFLSDTSRVSDRHVRSDRDLEGRVERALSREGVTTRAIQAGFSERSTRPWFGPPQRPLHANFGAPQDQPAGAPDASPGWQRPDAMRFPPNGGFHGMPPGAHPPRDMGVREAVISAQLGNGRWVNVETFWRVPPPDFVPRVIAAEILLYCAILAATLFFASRIANPLKSLTDTSTRVGAPGPAPNVTLRGPAEIRAAIGSFNDMSARVAALLREKDEMLGAIGHDLRTPIASLRIRAEGIVNQAERERFITTLDDMRQLLDDAIDMARIGQSSEQARQVDVSALADSLVEDYRSRGHDVTFSDSPRAPVLCKPALTRRMLRNLIDNAVKFGKRATVAMEIEGPHARLTITDEGPGLPEQELTRMLEPFVRLETSRNRSTGGAGLGLAIAARIAAGENATLQLANRLDAGGLVVTVTWARVIGSSLRLLRRETTGDVAAGPS